MVTALIFQTPDLWRELAAWCIVGSMVLVGLLMWRQMAQPVPFGWMLGDDYPEAVEAEQEAVEGSAEEQKQASP